MQTIDVPAHSSTCVLIRQLLGIRPRGTAQRAAFTTSLSSLFRSGIRRQRVHRAEQRLGHGPGDDLGEGVIRHRALARWGVEECQGLSARVSVVF